MKLIRYDEIKKRDGSVEKVMEEKRDLRDDEGDER